MQKLKGKKFAALVTDGFEQSELTEPVKAIEEAGGTVEIISPQKHKVKAWNKDNWGDTFKVDKPIDEANVEDYDGLLLPGGVMNPDQLRKDERAIDFVKGFFKGKTQKPVAAICHAPWTLINAGVVKGRKLTSYASLRQDLVNAGAKWTDEAVVVDNGLITSRYPDDLPAFNNKMIEEFREGRHETRAAHA